MAAYTVTVRRTITQTATLTISATESSIDEKCDGILETLSGEKGADRYGSQQLTWELDDEEFEIDSADEE